MKLGIWIAWQDFGFHLFRPVWFYSKLAYYTRLRPKLVTSNISCQVLKLVSEMIFLIKFYRNMNVIADAEGVF